MSEFRKGDRVESSFLGRGTYQAKRLKRWALVLWDKKPPKAYNGGANPCIEPLEGLKRVPEEEEVGYDVKFSYAHRISFYLDKMHPRYRSVAQVIEALRLDNTTLAEDVLCEMAIDGAANITNIGTIVYFQWNRNYKKKEARRGRVSR